MRSRHCLNGGKLADPSGVGIAKHRRSLHPGRDLLEQLQPFSAHAVFGIGKPCGVAARPRQTFDRAATHWISHLHEYDRHGTGGPH